MLFHHLSLLRQCRSRLPKPDPCVQDSTENSNLALSVNNENAAKKGVLDSSSNSDDDSDKNEKDNKK